MIDKYITSNDIYYEEVLREIKKSRKQLQPIFEAVTNSLESIRLLNSEDGKGEITITLFFSKKYLSGEELEFDKAVISDTGIGFDDNNFDRLKRYKDSRKGFRNKGSGRIQFLHFFNKSEYDSIYRDKDIFKRRRFTLSKSPDFLREDAIVFYQDDAIVDVESCRTSLALKKLLDPKDRAFYDSLTIADLKKALVSHYMVYFCVHQDTLPEIKIKYCLGDRVQAEDYIKPEDIPEIDAEQEIIVYYSRYSPDKNTVEKTEQKELFNLKAFKIDKSKLEKSEIKLTSKEEIVENKTVELKGIYPDDSIDGNRYLFVLSGDYIDDRDSDTRGELKIVNSESFVKERDLFSGDEILLEDIQSEVNSSILSMYEEIKFSIDKKRVDLEKLKSMFLLNDELFKTSNININDSEEKILSQVYLNDAKAIAKKDAEIKKHIDSLDSIDTSSSNYNEIFQQTISQLVKAIPLQNRTALTHYVARRKLVLELFDKIISRELNIQKESPRNIDEKLLHNLIFQQTSDNPEYSDLWLVNEDFIYFKGTSEGMLSDINVDGEKIIKEQFTEEEEKYRCSLGEDRTRKRPDVLLFPAEGKCIILEFKNPEVNLSEHLTQINRYASLIRNLCKESFNFNTFYGYLIGEKIDSGDVRDHDSDFKHAYHFDYVFRPSKPIVGKFGRSDGELYTEVIKYSTLLERAKKRNEIFINKLTGKSI